MQIYLGKTVFLSTNVKYYIGYAHLLNIKDFVDINFVHQLNVGSKYVIWLPSQY